VLRAAGAYCNFPGTGHYDSFPSDAFESIHPLNCRSKSQIFRGHQWKGEHIFKRERRGGAEKPGGYASAGQANERKVEGNSHLEWGGNFRERPSVQRPRKKAGGKGGEGA